MKYKILCTDGFSKIGRAFLEKNPLFQVSYFETLKYEELLSKIGVFDGLIVRSASTVSRDIIETGKNLKIVARAGVGTDNIDIDAATKNGILIVNAPSGNTISTAELAFAMILSLSRHIPWAAKAMSEGKWEKKKFSGTELAYKTLGVIGLGRVGREVARRGQAFKMNVVGYDPYLANEQFDALGVASVPLDELYKTADYITIHTQLTEETQNMITMREIKKMKKTVRIINCARGGIVNERDLVTALKNGDIAGAALDVFTKEPFEDPMFCGLENCITTPHLGASTVEAQEAVAIETATAVTQFFAEGFSPNAVNLPGSAPQEGAQFILAEKLGIIASNLCHGQIQKITFSSTKRRAEILTSSAVKGVLSKIVGPITFVNSLLVAKERGLVVTEEVADFSVKDSIGVALTTADSATTAVWGTWFADGSLKIVRYNDYNLEIEPIGTILFIHNLDQPGIIGNICTILGRHSVNIAEMQNVRHGKGMDALTVIRVDEEIAPIVLEEIKREVGIKSVSILHF